MEATRQQQEEYALANDYNSNSAFLNSVLQKLTRLETELKGLQDIYKECKTSAGDTESQRQEVDVNINHEIDIIRKELYTKLNSMLDQLKSHQIQQQAERGYYERMFTQNRFIHGLFLCIALISYHDFRISSFIFKRRD